MFLFKLNHFCVLKSLNSIPKNIKYSNSKRKKKRKTLRLLKIKTSNFIKSFKAMIYQTFPWFYSGEQFHLLIDAFL